MTWRNLPRGISTARSSPFATPDCGSCRQRNHKQSWQSFTEIALPMLVAPGFREEDVLRLKDAQRNSLVVDLMNNNEEEFAKERLQATVFAGTPCGHPVPGTRKGIDSIALDDVREFWRTAYTQGALRVGVAGDLSGTMIATLQQELSKLPPGAGLSAVQAVVGRRPQGIEVEIRSTPRRVAPFASCPKTRSSRSVSRSTSSRSSSTVA